MAKICTVSINSLSGAALTTLSVASDIDVSKLKEKLLDALGPQVGHPAGKLLHGDEILNSGTLGEHGIETDTELTWIQGEVIHVIVQHTSSNSRATLSVSPHMSVADFEKEATAKLQKSQLFFLDSSLYAQDGFSLHDKGILDGAVLQVLGR
mmetsp:Transcript_90597/g.142108  ORF Transcript_90597/g.142108 Transcript_90597/m.142108 type:complete len:152 (-) Transcript_90597:41-496(-)